MYDNTSAFELVRVVENHSLGKASFGRREWAAVKQHLDLLSSTRRVPHLASDFQSLAAGRIECVPSAFESVRVVENHSLGEASFGRWKWAAVKQHLVLLSSTRRVPH